MRYSIGIGDSWIRRTSLDLRTAERLASAVTNVEQVDLFALLADTENDAVGMWLVTVKELSKFRALCGRRTAVWQFFQA